MLKYLQGKPFVLWLLTLCFLLFPAALQFSRILEISADSALSFARNLRQDRFNYRYHAYQRLLQPEIALSEVLRKARHCVRFNSSPEQWLSDMTAGLSEFGLSNFDLAIFGPTGSFSTTRKSWDPSTVRDVVAMLAERHEIRGSMQRAVRFASRYAHLAAPEPGGLIPRFRPLRVSLPEGLVSFSPTDTPRFLFPDQVVTLTRVPGTPTIAWGEVSPRAKKWRYFLVFRESDLAGSRIRKIARRLARERGILTAGGSSPKESRPRSAIKGRISAYPNNVTANSPPSSGQTLIQPTTRRRFIGLCLFLLTAGGSWVFFHSPSGKRWSAETKFLLALGGGLIFPALSLTVIFDGFRQSNEHRDYRLAQKDILNLQKMVGSALMRYFEGERKLALEKAVRACLSAPSSIRKLEPLLCKRFLLSDLEIVSSQGAVLTRPHASIKWEIHELLSFPHEMRQQIFRDLTRRGFFLLGASEALLGQEFLRSDRDEGPYPVKDFFDLNKGASSATDAHPGKPSVDGAAGSPDESARFLVGPPHAPDYEVRYRLARGYFFDRFYRRDLLVRQRNIPIQAPKAIFLSPSPMILNSFLPRHLQPIQEFLDYEFPAGGFLCIMKDSRNQENLVGFFRMEEYPGILFCGIVSLENIRKASEWIDQVGLGFVLVWFFLFLLYRKFFQTFLFYPIDHLQHGFESIQRGDYRPTGLSWSIGEIREMNRLFESLKQNLRQLDFAKVIQEGFLPRHPYESPRCVIYGASRMMTRVGGDYFEIRPLADHRCLIAIGDVSGHGLAAAVVVGIAKMTISHFADREVPLPKVLAILSHQMRQLLNRTKMMTLFLGILDERTSTLTYANAGHLYPVVLHQDGSFELIQQPSAPLGILPNATYRSGAFTLRSEDVLILYSDGLIEAQDRNGQPLGYDPFFAELVRRRHLPAVDMVRDTFLFVSRYSEPHPWADDVTLLVVKGKNIPPFCNVAPPRLSESPSS